jgi:PadR family transcriptional regulator, regulatory protein PadR
LLSSGLSRSKARPDPALPAPPLAPYIYVTTTYGIAMLRTDLKKGSAEFLVLSLLEHERRHGYELNKLIESRSKGVLTFHIASLYPLLYRMEDRGWIVGRWVEKAGERRRRFYSITPAGRRALRELREGWLEFAAAVAQVTGVRYG